MGLTVVSEESVRERRERIVLLLEHYLDVEAGMRDELGTGVHLPLMCKAWNKPDEGYPELRYQLGRMVDEMPNLYRHLVWAYYYPARKRALVCPRCHAVMPTTYSKNFHKHGHANIAIVPRVVRITPEWVQRSLVDKAVDWLEANWRGAVFVPDVLRSAA